MRNANKDTMTYYTTLLQKYKIDDRLLDKRTKKRAIGAVLEQLDCGEDPKKPLKCPVLKKLRKAFGKNRWFKKAAAGLTLAAALSLFQAPPLEAAITHTPPIGFQQIVHDDDGNHAKRRHIPAPQTSSVHLWTEKVPANSFAPASKNALLLDEDSDVVYFKQSHPAALTVIDTTIDDWQTLAKGVKKGAILLLGAEDEPLDAILSELRNLGVIESLSIISHGSSGTLNFKNRAISSATLERNKEKWQELGSYLSREGDILLYGCNVAEGKEGKEFVSRLADLTGADVGASFNPTGNSEKGGDWVLEAMVGELRASPIFAPDFLNTLDVIDSTVSFYNGWKTSTVGSGVEFQIPGFVDIDVSATQAVLTFKDNGIDISSQWDLTFSGDDFSSIDSASLNTGSSTSPHPTISHDSDSILIGTGGAWNTNDQLVIDFTSSSTAPPNNAPTDITLTTSSIDDSATNAGADVGNLSTTDSDGGDSHTYSLVNDGVSANGDCGTASDHADNGSFQIDGSTLETSGSISAGSYDICLQTNDGTTTFQEGFTITVNDTTPPTISGVSIPNSAMKVGDTVTATITVTSDTDDYTNGGISGTIGGFTLGNFTKNSDTEYTAQFTITDGGTDVASGSDIPVNFTIDDSSSNTSSAFTTAINQASDPIDANKPSGYSVAFTTDPINNANKSSASFQFASAEVGATYNYSIDDTNGGTSAVTGSGTIGTATDTISNIDLSSLDDDTLTATVYLTDTSANQGDNATDTVIKETTIPTKSSSTPADNATAIAIADNLTFQFSENIAKGSGNIVLYKADGTTVETFDVATSGQISVATDTLTIDPTADLEYGENYYIQIANTAIEDSTGNTFAGISDNSTWNFTTIPKVVLSVDNTAISENGGVATGTLTLQKSDGTAFTATADTTVTLTYSGTATGSGTDYTASTSSVTIASGTSSNTFTITGVDDSPTSDDAETVIVDINAISTSNAVEVGTEQVTITLNENEPAVIGGITTTTTIDDTATTTPFSSVTISDNENDNVSVTVSLDTQAKGSFTSASLTGSGFTDNADGSYSLASTTPANAQAAIRQLVFDPTENRVAPASTEVTTFTITVNDGNSDGSDNTTTVTSTSVNDAPEISSGSGATAAVNVAENTTAVTTVTSTDADTGDTKAFTIIGGADQALFSIVEATGVLTFDAAPNYENPTDAGDTAENNTYVVEVQVSDGDDTDTQTITVTVTNDNAEAPTVTLNVNPTSVAENGGTSTITATLSEEVSEATTVTIGRKNTSTATLTDDFTLSSTTITIPAGSTTGTATLTGVDDSIDDNTESAIVEITNVTGGESATENGTQEQTITITDDDTAGFTVTQSSGSTSVAESGTTDSFTVVLDTEPTSDVVIAVSSGDTTEATVNASSLTFTAENWNTPQTITVTGVDDALVDGSVNTDITLSVTDGSSDDTFDPLADQTVTVTTTDDDTAGFSLSKTTANVDENGTTDTFSVVLSAQPDRDVVFNITSNDTGEATVSPASLTFTNANWDTNQTVTITGVDDALTDGDINSNITVSVNDGSSDNNFDPLSNQSVTVTTSDDDNQAPIITEGTSVDVNMSEDGSPTAFSLTLNATDGDNDTLTWTIDTNATKGIASVSGSGTSKAINYTPNANKNGNDSFVVKVDDGNTGEDTITVNVNIAEVNDTPTFVTNLSDLSINEDNGTISYELNATDIEGNDLNISVESNNTSLITVSKASIWSDPLVQGSYDGVPLDFNLTTVANANGIARITIIANDREDNTTSSYDINVTAVNDAPTLQDPSNITKTEDFTPFVVELNATDIDSSSLTYNAKSSDTSIATVSVNGNNVAVSPITHAYGNITIDVNVSDGEYTKSQSFDLNISSVNDIPVFSGDFTSSVMEDSTSAYSGTISIDDNDTNEAKFQPISNQSGTYGRFNLDSNGSWSYDLNSSINSIQVLGTSQSVTDTFSITSQDGNISENFTVTINGVNDAPTFTTDLSDLTINEDNSTINYELNVTDIEGDSLTVSVDSNDSTILAVSSSWDMNQSITHGDYNNIPLDFNLTTVENANGEVTITINVKDSNGGSTSDLFTVNVNAVNDKPSLASLTDMIVYKNFDDINYTLPETDVDGDVLDYNITTLNSELVDLSVAGNTASIKSIEGQSGKTDVNITVSDSEYSVSEIFTLQILSFEDGDSVEETGEVNVSDENGSKNTTVTVPDDNLTVQTKEDSNGSIFHEVDLDGKKVTATSDVNGSVTQITSNGVQTRFENASVKAEVNATVTGEASHVLSKDGKTTKAVSKFVGAKTKIKDVNGSIEIETAVVVDNNTSIQVVAKEDGKAIHSVKKGTKTSKATSNVPGANTIIDETGTVNTSVDTKKPGVASGKRFEAVAQTDANGETVTKFRLIDTNTNQEESPEPTLDDNEKFPVGSEVEIKEDENDNTVIHIQTKTPVLTVPKQFKIK